MIKLRIPGYINEKQFTVTGGNQDKECIMSQCYLRAQWYQQGMSGGYTEEDYFSERHYGIPLHLTINIYAHDRKKSILHQAKCIADALIGLAYKDDRQICALTVRRIVTDDPEHIDIKVEEANDDNVKHYRLKHSITVDGKAETLKATNKNEDGVYSDAEARARDLEYTKQFSQLPPDITAIDIIAPVVDIPIYGHQRLKELIINEHIYPLSVKDPDNIVHGILAGVSGLNWEGIDEINITEVYNVTDSKIIVSYE